MRFMWCVLTQKRRSATYSWPSIFHPQMHYRTWNCTIDLYRRRASACCKRKTVRKGPLRLSLPSKLWNAPVYSWAFRGGDSICCRAWYWRPLWNSQWICEWRTPPGNQAKNGAAANLQCDLHDPNHCHREHASRCQHKFAQCVSFWIVWENHFDSSGGKRTVRFHTAFDWSQPRCLPMSASGI